VIGKNYNEGKDGSVDNMELVQVNEAIRNHPIEIVGRKLRGYMSDMKKITFGE
jgi:ketol-acid reductoisomerase